jgi:hypothetical protein
MHGGVVAPGAHCLCPASSRNSELPKRLSRVSTGIVRLFLRAN